MAEASLRTSESPVIDWKKASSKDVQRALVQVTKQQKWMDSDSWKFYLKGRGTLFNNIAKSPKFIGLDWGNPDNWAPLEKEFVLRSKSEAKTAAKVGEIPAWGVEGDWMDRHPELVQWMRKEHWRNNHKKLKELFGQGISQELTRLEEEAPDGTNTDAGEAADSGPRWQEVMLQDQIR